MKYAIISDIHANLEALEKALWLIDEAQVDEIICLGDVVGYGANPNECVELIRSRCTTVVMGNHDAAALDPAMAYDFNPAARAAVLWTADQLTEVNREFLSKLPMVFRKERLQFVHSSPRSPERWDYIVGTEDAAEAFRDFEEQLCFIGHTHVPGLFARSGRVKSITRNDQYLVNVGSIGQPRDGNPMLAFGLFDSDTWSYELVRAKYDIQTAAEKIVKAGLPQELGYRLQYGM